MVLNRLRSELLGFCVDSDNLKVLVVFVLVYAALFVLGIISPLQDWNFTFDFGRLDYTLFLLPIPGFFFIYYLIPYLRNELGFGQAFIYAFPAIYIIACYLAFYTGVFYFYGNQAFLNNVDISVFQLDYFSMFIDSSFIYFMLAGLGGWGARILMENFSEESK